MMNGPAFLLIWASMCVCACVCVSALVRVTITAGQLVECESIYEIKATLRLDIGKLIRTHRLIPLNSPVKSTTFFP